MADTVITVENLGKKYRIAHQAGRQRYTALRDVLTEKVAAPLRWPRTRERRSEDGGQRAEDKMPTSDLRSPTSNSFGAPHLTPNKTSFILWLCVHRRL